MDEEAAKANPIFDGRVAHGYLILSFAAGLFVDPDPGPVLANTGLENLRFLTPLYHGDSLRVERRLQRAAVAQMLLTLAGEQTLAKQESCAYQSAPLPGTPGILRQQIPDLGRVVNQQHALVSNPQRDRAGAAGHQQV